MRGGSLGLRTLSWAVLLTAVAGCGGSGLVPVEGAVTLDGKPVAGATVTFMPEGDTGRMSVGLTDDNGVFRLNEGGAFPGSYKVLVSKYEDTDLSRVKAGASDPVKAEMEYYKNLRKTFRTPNMRSLLPAIYEDGSKTPLQWTVPGDGKKTLELKGSRAP